MKVSIFSYHWRTSCWKSLWLASDHWLERLLEGLIKSCSVRNGPQWQPNHHPSTQLWNHPLSLLLTENKSQFLSQWSCYDCHQYTTTTAIPAAYYYVIVSSMSSVTLFSCVTRSPLFINRRADQENQSPLCFRLCRKLQRSRMPSSGEWHSCLALCRESRDK